MSDVENRLQEIRASLSVDRAKFAESVQRIADKMPYPEPSYYPTMASFIHKAWVEDECVFYIPYGPLRYGKSAYAFKTMAALYGTWDPHVLKEFTVYEPFEFINVIKHPLRSNFKYPVLNWEDAGVHLAALEWNDPILREICKYMQVVGTQFAGVILSSPLPTYVIKKIRGMPSCANIRIYKVNQHPNKPRIARGYYQWLAPDMKKSGVRPFIDDKFSAIMPTKFYEWYEPYRKHYNNEVFEKLQKQLYAQAAQTLEKNPEPKSVSDRVRKAVEPIV